MGIAVPAAPDATAAPQAGQNRAPSGNADPQAGQTMVTRRFIRNSALISPIFNSKRDKTLFPSLMAYPQREQVLPCISMPQRKQFMDTPPYYRY
jgi:hypothetical protein